MSEKIVYVLGAGFSAPLGLPLVGNFLFKSKDMYFTQPERYVGFQKIFDEVGRLSKVKNYFNSDLLNIEEILSLIEMEGFLESRKLSENFLTYIKDVIDYCTPQVSPRGNNLCSNWNDVWLGHDAWSPYLRFVANLLRLKVQFTTLRNGEKIVEGLCRSNFQSDYSYSVVSLNYDRVVEIACEHLTQTFPTDLQSRLFDSNAIPSAEYVPITKLHGCVSSGTIVPPTWNKGAHPEIAKEWSKAYALLRDATQIRFIGYSLPDNDAYVRYLLKAACVNAPHLKMIDVICLVSDQTVRERYRRVISFRDLRFCGTSTENYFAAIAKEAERKDRSSVQNNNSIMCNALESTHDQIMTSLKE